MRHLRLVVNNIEAEKSEKTPHLKLIQGGVSSQSFDKKEQKPVLVDVDLLAESVVMAEFSSMVGFKIRVISNHKFILVQELVSFVPGLEHVWEIRSCFPQEKEGLKRAYTLVSELIKNIEIKEDEGWLA